ncbi:MAG: hypothetical protein RBU37_02590 [Myxococcota bacterium]|jgi:hypothetical protein|nr:hypothetical protein [Myxococcota bacterium]
MSQSKPSDEAGLVSVSELSPPSDLQESEPDEASPSSTSAEEVQDPASAKAVLSQARLETEAAFELENSSPAQGAETTPLHPAERGLRALPLERSAGLENADVWSWMKLFRALRAQGPAAWLQARWRPASRLLLIALVVYAIAFSVYALFAWNRFWEPSDDTHFVYQAHAFKMGKLEMPWKPPHGNDWASYIELPVKGDETLKGIWLDRGQGKFRALDGAIYTIKSGDIDHRKAQNVRYFVSFPPGPAVLMMPFLPDADSPELDFRDPKKLGFNDVQFTVAFAALNVVLMFLLLLRLSALGVSSRSLRENILLTLLFGMGSNVLWCSVMGQVWFTALVVGLTFTLLYIHAAIGTRHPFLAGLFLACGMATRTPIAFSFVLFAYFLFFPNGRLRRAHWGEFFSKAVLFAVPILVIGGLLMWMNQARFENPMEFGHTYLAQGGLGRVQTYGLFNYHFLSKNLLAAFALLPRIQPWEPYVILSKHGMSLFLTTPPLLYLLAYRSGVRLLDRKWFWGLVLVSLAMIIPGMFYQNTGWSQFGFRFSLDYTPYLVLLLALNRRKMGTIFIALLVLGILVNVFGAITFNRMPLFYEDWLIDPDR